MIFKYTMLNGTKVTKILIRNKIFCWKINQMMFGVDLWEKGHFFIAFRRRYKISETVPISSE